MADDKNRDRFQGYAVFLYPQALEILGEAIRPYLLDGPHGPHVMCTAIDTGGALIDMTLHGRSEDGHEVEIELMIPTGMVRMIVSARSDAAFGFGPRVYAPEPGASVLPPTALASAQPASPAVGFAAPDLERGVQVPGTPASIDPKAATPDGKLPPEG
ncbi:hypothetical protein [Lysobacter auxotrophicus]|uniref:Stringent starvation protein B n=1 Tax=Lysobacter auxotrophicus TaxID=2992573 RepID=A0ABM8DFG4_9GAMM|nr:hypothetical protein [Lysobacter auxotrophicus]BDU17342.1 hypothetical protein LA521A_25430 [Lysobacter auxotrophicus]